MDVIFLGAGRPARGARPSALKNVGLNTKAMDWQLRALESLEKAPTLNYVGGYSVEDVISSYPQLNFTVVSDWATHPVLHSLLKAPLSRNDTLVTYTDTVFRDDAVRSLTSSSADVSFGVDTQWRSRYRERTAQDMAMAETIKLEEFSDGYVGQAEFTGLMFLKAHVVAYLSALDEALVGKTLIDLLYHVKEKGFTVEPFDLVGHWAEFNSPADVARFVLGTKAETLARLEPVLQKSHIGKQVSFTTPEWRANKAAKIQEISDVFSDLKLVVRSSAKAEDNWHNSNAGGFDSILNVDGGNPIAVAQAIETVLASYGEKSSDDDQVLVQKQVSRVQFSGVVMTCSLETGAPYYCFNFDDESHSTDSVTGGGKAQLRTITVARSDVESLAQLEPKLVPVLYAVQELESILGFGRLDIEFAVGESGRVHIFQVRPITVDHSAYEVRDDACAQSLKSDKFFFRAQQPPGPFLHGRFNIFSNMSDWNPAEIVGIRPKPLAMSLYRELITNEVWATQRAEFGYRDVRPQPLIGTFSGQPYVDVRASLNSFIPASLSQTQARELANAYLQILRKSPLSHDKIEFDVAFTTWTPSLKDEAFARLTPYGVSARTIEAMIEGLRLITVKALTRLAEDTAPIRKLASRRQLITASELALAGQAYALLDDCRRFGTLPFAHAARAGFMATTFLKSLVATGTFTTARHHDFMRSLNTVASDFQNDKFAHASGELSQDQLVESYGHLRPGTYEISTKAYWEDPDRYLSCDGAAPATSSQPFSLTTSESEAIARLLAELGSDRTPTQFVNYLREATEARESVKFEFTKSLSRALDVCVRLGDAVGITRDDMSFMEFQDLEALRLNLSSANAIKEEIVRRRRRHSVTELIQLPSMIVDELEFSSFERPGSEPNFATNKKIEAPALVMVDDGGQDVSGKIVLVPQADPGYDWLFGRGIAGLITMYGGANSHMSIRAIEMGLPAAIGVGQKLYERLARMQRIQLDCANRIIKEA